MRDTDWLDPADDDEAAGNRRIRPRLIVLASLPWLLVAALLVLPGRLGLAEDPTEPSADVAPDDAATQAVATEDVTTEASDPPTAEGHHAHDPPGDVGPSGGDLPVAVPDDTGGEDGPVSGGEVVTLEGVEHRGRWRVEPGVEEAVALAVLAGRAWLTGVEPVLSFDELGPQATGGYAEHLVVEAVEQPAPDAVVVTLVAVVLDTTAPTSSPAIRRIAVPLALTGDGPRFAGQPWELSPPVVEAVVLPREETDDTRELAAARAALGAAGLEDHELVGLHHTSSWPVVAQVTTGADTTSEIWLRRHLDGFVVAGTTLAGAEDTTAAVDDTTGSGGRP